MILKYFEVIILVALISVPTVSAAYDDDFKTCLAEKIFNDCEKGIIWPQNPVYFPDGKLVIDRGQVLTRDKIKNIIDYIDILDNSYTLIGGSFNDYPERFRCDNKSLRVNNNRYYWNGIEVTCPRQITNLQETNLIKVGDIRLTIFDFSLSLISISLISIVIFMITIIRKREISIKILNKKYIFKAESINTKKDGSGRC